MQKNLTHKLLMTSCLSGCSIDCSMNISNTYTTKRIPHNTCLCEICENTVLLSKGIARAFPSNIPTDSHTIAEHYSCDSGAAECMLGQCDKCSDQGLKSEDFEKTLSASHSDSDSKEREFDRTVGFYEWKRGDNGYMMKSQVTLSTEDAWPCGIVRFKAWKNMSLLNANSRVRFRTSKQILR